MKEAGTGIAGGAGRPSRRERALRGLGRIAWDCGADDWDGEGAIGVTEEIVEETRKFVAVLPEDCLPDPERDIEALADGEIVFEWQKDRRNMFMASVGKGGRIVYAGLFGGDRCCGDERIADGRIPEAMLASIRRALSAPVGTVAARRGATGRGT